MNSVKLIDPSNLRFWHPWEGDGICRNNSAYNASVYGSPTYEDMALGKGIVFDSVGKYATIPSGGLNIQPFSVEVLFKVINITSPFVVIGQYDASPIHFYWYLGVAQTSGQAYFAIGAFSMSDRVLYMTNLLSGKVYHVIITTGGSGSWVQGTVNGVHYGGILNDFMEPQPSNSPITIGRLYTTNYPNGVIYDSKLETRYLTEQERSMRYFSKKHLYGG